jgi:hypothetical protein
MCSAAIPAYWLSRRLMRPDYALLVAVATAAGGPMLYHGYLTSEAVAYPVFLLAVGVCGRALELDAHAIARPRPNLTLYRTAGPVRFRSIAFGVHHDGWADSIVRFAAFPREASGAYHAVLSLPSGRVARQVRLQAGPSGVASSSRPEPRRPSRSRSRDTPFRSSP